MIEKSTTQKVLEVFFENPSKEDFHLRELSRITKLSMPTIISTTDKLAKEHLIIKTPGMVTTIVKAYRENEKFTRYKLLHNLKKIYESEIIEFLSKEYHYPKAIILFGSFSRGEDIESSDIDIAILIKRKLKLDLSKYEKILKKTVNVHEVNIDKISNEFKANLANGIVLEGSW